MPKQQKQEKTTERSSKPLTTEEFERLMSIMRKELGLKKIELPPDQAIVWMPMKRPGVIKKKDKAPDRND